jgi:hypothetical protein
MLARSVRGCPAPAAIATVDMLPRCAVAAQHADDDRSQARASALQPSSRRLYLSAVWRRDRKHAITRAQQSMPDRGEHCAKRAAADIEGHSAAAEHGQPGRLSPETARPAPARDESRPAVSQPLSGDAQGDARKTRDRRILKAAHMGESSSRHQSATTERRVTESGPSAGLCAIVTPKDVSSPIPFWMLDNQ